MRSFNHFAASFLLLLIAFTVNAQDHCQTTADLNWMQINAPDRYQRFHDLENFTVNYVSQNARLINGNGLIVIPVVVHVLHRGEPEGTGLNISMAQIQAQIDVLNRDYVRLNDDRVNTPADFLSVASDFGIEFRLACVDPNGNPSNGVVRKYTTITNFFTSLRPDRTYDEEAIGIKVNSTGDAAWPTDRYLNIWVCNLALLYGYATFPADYPAYPQFDGVVVLSSAFGGISTASGRTATHEIGHWLNLRHLEGDAGDCGTDFVDDTPPQWRSINFQHCPAYPQLTGRCNTADPSVMYMNYMEFVYDNCMNLFTNGQRTRARAVFATGGPRALHLNGFFGFAGQPTSVICRGTLTVTPMCVPATWNVTSGPAYINSGQGTNKAEIVATGNGTVHITATWGNYTAETDISVSVDSPFPQGFTYASSNYNYYSGPLLSSYSFFLPSDEWGLATFNITDSRYSSFSWSPVSVPSGSSWAVYGPQNQQLNLNIQAVGPAYNSNTITIQLNAQGPCGAYSTYFSATAVVRGWFGYSIAPNPAQDNLTISVDNANEKTNSQNRIYGIKIIDVSGTLRKAYEYKSGIISTRISLAGLNSGLYLISVFDGQGWNTTQLFIQK